MANQRILIGIATFRRPVGLELLLASIQEDTTAINADIVVVDNDPDRSGHSTVKRLNNLSTVYLSEPSPGIAAARNCALEYALSNDYDAIVYVDDDEIVHKGWLGHLLGVADRFEAHVVCGPVMAVLPDDAPGWIRTGRFFDRPEGENGGSVKWPATNNVYISLAAPGIEEGIRFSQSFSMTGGSDTDFFYNLKKHGSQIVWSSNAIVSETIPSDRARFVWVWRRGRRLGNVSARILRRKYPGIVIGTLALGRMVLALPLALFARVSGRPWGTAVMHLPKGVGMLQALNGKFIEEYKRL